jgi:chitinase
MPQSCAFRAAALLAPLFAATLGCEGQPSTESPTSPALSGQPLSATNVPDQGKAIVEIVVNAPPQVDAMTSFTGNVASNDPLTLQVTASDPDHDPLSFDWTSICPGTFDRADRAQVTFNTGTLAAGADCAFQVSVNDGRGGTATGTLVLSAALPVINVAPAMGIVYQSTDAADVSEVVLLHASATDPEGQTLTWAWKASDGAFSDQTDQAGISDVKWTAPAIPGVRCTITATATDPGSASSSWVFTVQVSG